MKDELLQHYNTVSARKIFRLYIFIKVFLLFVVCRPWMQPGGGAGRGAGAGGDDEAPKDPGARTTHQSYTEKDFEGRFRMKII